MVSQLTLPLQLQEDATFENFYPGKNASTVRYLNRFLANEAEQFVYLWGKAQVGLSHLLQAACQEVSAANQSAFYLPLAEHASISPQCCEGLENFYLVCIDDLHLIAQNIFWEEAIFHLYNRIIAAGNRLIVSAKSVPSDINFSLPDLKSRMASSLVFQLHEITDNEKRMVLQQRANNRGMVLSDEVALYLLQHHPRKFSSLINILDKLDKESLVQQRKLTIPFVKDVLSA